MSKSALAQKILNSFQKPGANKKASRAAGLTLPEHRVLFYAPGGGTGHLNRAYALARSLKKIRPHLSPLILTSAPFLPPLIQEGLSVLRMPSPTEQNQSGFSLQLLETLCLKASPQVLLVDTHSVGMNEDFAQFWSKFKGYKIFLRRDLQTPLHTAYDQNWLLTPAEKGYLVNREKSELFAPELARKILRASSNLPLVLIAHNGPPSETYALFMRLWLALKHAPLELRFASFLSPLPELAAYWIHYFPLSEILTGVDLLIGGGGYNLIAESRVFSKKILSFAFERPLDHQAARIQPHEILNTEDSPQQIQSRIFSRLKDALPEASSDQTAHQLAQEISDLL